MLNSRGLHKLDTLCPAATAAFSGRWSHWLSRLPLHDGRCHALYPARSLVHDIIGKHSDLMAMFNEFLMRCEVGYWETACEEGCVQHIGLCHRRCACLLRLWLLQPLG